MKLRTRPDSRKRSRGRWLALLLLLGVTPASPAANNQLLGWNNLGMHCMDSDYSVFSILPPYNTIEAQLIVAGRLVTNGSGYTVTYQAVADPDGSINTTAMNKGNFYPFAGPLYGAALAAESGLAGWAMPGTNNVPQTMLFESTNRPAPGVATRVNWFRAEGIPISPYDDAGNKNYYPLMRLIARNGGGAAIATNDIVLPVSDEMDCRACHASGTMAEARPNAGWVWSANPERDFRLNILRFHDQRQFASHGSVYRSALAANGFNPRGLYQTVVADGKPILCALCHASEALGTAGFPDVPPLTASIHSRHATVVDPDLHLTLDDSAHRSACYRCHPGSATRCLRGAMGGAIASDGTMSMQCQSCHGNMCKVGASDRVGWFMEPNCQSCHSGTATGNSGQIRYTSVFETNGAVRVPTNTTFATQPNTPAPGLSLYRFSAGHGGLQCSACHGSTHAEFPATHRNDNLRNEAIQGHAGVTAECTACHTTMSASSSTAAAGPHGMHPIGSTWVSFHHDAIGGSTGRQKCAACHGSDFRGSVLSRTFGKRTLTASFDGGRVTLDLFQGAIVSCYSCHNGPTSESINNSAPPTVADVATNTTSGRPVQITLPLTGAGATMRIISQATHGSVGLSNTVATYFPDPGFVGTDQFTFAGWDGMKNSRLATGTVAVAAGPYSISVAGHAPTDYPSGWPAPFSAVAVPSNTTASVAYEWDFGDGTPHGTTRYASHIYAAPGSYNWTLTARVGTESAVAQGSVAIGSPMVLDIAMLPDISVAWPRTAADAVLERSGPDGPGPVWTPATNAVRSTTTSLSVRITDPDSAEFFRLRQVQ